MHRFFLPPEACETAVVSLDAADSHHARRVLRLEPGDPVEILDGAGRILAGRVAAVERQGVTVVVDGVCRIEAPPRIGLAVSVLKGRAMDWLVQKATELGATEIHPLLPERGVVRIAADEAAAKIEGWRTTAIEACKQCGNPWLPKFHAPTTPEGFLAAHSGGLLLVAALWGSPRLPGEILAGLPERPDGITVVVGPEGDLTPQEARTLEGAGAVPFTLGPLVLRAETAAIAALAVLQHECRRLGLPHPPGASSWAR